MQIHNALSVVVAGGLLITGAGCQNQSDVAIGSKATLQTQTFAAASTSKFQARSSSGDEVALALAANQRTAIGRPDRLCVMSFNMKHKDNSDQLSVIADDLRHESPEAPDFILLQEVLFKRSKRSGAENTAAALGDLLGYHCEGTKRTSDREGVAILSRYPFSYYASKELKSQTSRLLLGFNRVSVMGEFQVPGAGLVRVVNVHLTNWGFEERVRSNQLKETLQWVADRERQLHADVTFLGGDFNMLPDGSEIALITDRSVTGPLKFANHNSNEPTRGSAGRPNARIDYIFASSSRPDLKMIDEDILWKNGLHFSGSPSRFWPSDHLPVLHEYAINPRRIRPRGEVAQGAGRASTFIGP